MRMQEKYVDLVLKVLILLDFLLHASINVPKMIKRIVTLHYIVYICISKVNLLENIIDS